MAARPALSIALVIFALAWPGMVFSAYVALHAPRVQTPPPTGAYAGTVVFRGGVPFALHDQGVMRSA